MMKIEAKVWSGEQGERRRARSSPGNSAERGPGSESLN